MVQHTFGGFINHHGGEHAAGGITAKHDGVGVLGMVLDLLAIFHPAGKKAVFGAWNKVRKD